MKRILLVPHGRTDWNEIGRFQGHSDIPMNALGRRQAQCLAQSLREEKIATILASDLSRASETASIIAAELGLAVQLDPRLRELNFGDWEGLTWREIAKKDGEIWQRWEQGADSGPPNGEALSTLAQRIGPCLEQIAAIPPENDNGASLVVGHRGALRVLICVALGLEPTLYRRFHLLQTSVSELWVGPEGAVLHRLNDARHLRELTR